jgi:diguanylate cyclase (GGDEF)-like protein
MRALGVRLTEAWRGRPVADDAPMPADAPHYARLVNGFEAQGAGWLWETDRAGRLTYLSAKVARQIAMEPEAALGLLLADLFHDMGGANGERTLHFHLNARASFTDFEVKAASPGVDRCWSISGRPWFDEMDQFRGFVGSGTDLTEKRRSEAEIARLARFDALTGLANRTSMRAALAQALSGQSAAWRPIALLLIDLDRFKAVNDTMGHPAGDALLQQVAQRLTKVVGDAGLVGRLGGDEFEVMLAGERRHERLAAQAQAIIAAVAEPFYINGARVLVGCSIGMALAPEHGRDPEGLVRSADLALYAAKAGGRGRHCFYREELLTEARTRRALEDDLRGALAAGQLRLQYQPVVSTGTAEVVGYEALLRWHHPTRGLVSPAEFIPIAEESGLIDPIGEWVMRTACRTAAGWPGRVRVAVNVSPVQFAKPAFAAIVADALAASGLPAGRLELEITEGVFLDGSQSTDQMFAALKQIGVRLALDDFGTGYSSLGYLRTAPFDKIKIDQSFVRGARIPGNRNAAIIKAIVTLADTLELETPAEGVEAQDEIELIRELGCSHIQGYVYGRPMDEDAVLVQLGQPHGVAAVGVKHTRAPRTTMLRSAPFRRGGRDGTVRVRNISATGVMIEAVDGLATGERIAIELSGELRDAEVRWVREGRAGLQFDQPLPVR